MHRKYMILISAGLALATLLLPVVGADAIGELESGYILFRGYNLCEVSLLGWLPLLCPVVIVTACRKSEKKGTWLVALCSVLSCLGWLVGTIKARAFLLNIESIEPVAVEYRIGLLLGLAANVAMFVTIALPNRKKDKEEILDA